jgi:hypothetical protein
MGVNNKIKIEQNYQTGKEVERRTNKTKKTLKRVKKSISEEVNCSMFNTTTF